MLGAAGAPRDVTAEEKTLFLGLKGSIEAKAGKTFADFEPVSVSTQTVAGTNYFVKVNVGGDDALHVRVHKPLPGQGEPTVAGVHAKKAGDALTHVEPN